MALTPNRHYKRCLSFFQQLFNVHNALPDDLSCKHIYSLLVFPCAAPKCAGWWEAAVDLPIQRWASVWRKSRFKLIGVILTMINARSVAVWRQSSIVSSRAPGRREFGFFLHPRSPLSLTFLSCPLLCLFSIHLICTLQPLAFDSHTTSLSPLFTGSGLRVTLLPFVIASYPRLALLISLSRTLLIVCAVSPSGRSSIFGPSGGFSDLLTPLVNVPCSLEFRSAGYTSPVLVSLSSS